jgi:hypothetical protein
LGADGGGERGPRRLTHPHGSQETVHVLQKLLKAHPQPPVVLQQLLVVRLQPPVSPLLAGRRLERGG